MQIRTPDWALLENIVSAARTDLLICTPYFSAEGINRVFDAMAEGIGDGH
jgi:hypothetical protein